MDQDVSEVKLRSIQDFFDKLIARQGLIIHSKTVNLTYEKLYTNYTRNPTLRHRLETKVDDHSVTTEPMEISYNTSRDTNNTTTYLRCHEMDSSTESILGGESVY